MKTVTVDFINAFSEQLFHGNSAAVVITDIWLDDELMQKIASENNLSETAFVVKKAEHSFAIRWFSPLKEIDFCGHATLASAFVLFERLTCSRLCFSAPAVGNMEITQLANGLIEMNFPKRPPAPIDEIPKALLQGLSITPLKVLRNQQAYFAIFAHQQEVIELTTKNESLTQLAPYDVIATAPAKNEQYDFVSRYFWPANGGDEDPVTGSAHTGLAPYWAEQLNKNNLMAFQASARGGYLACRVTEERVFISGTAVRYLTGQIHLPC